MEPIVTLNEELANLRVEYAHRCFTNTQELIRFMDQKAGFVLAAVGILSAALGTLVTNVFAGNPTTSLQISLRYAGIAFFLAYLFVGFAVVLVATSVFLAIPNRLRPDTTAPGLLFPLILLNKYKSHEEMYLRTLCEITPGGILHDYANQIMEIANIYQAKQKHVNRSIMLFRWSSVLWLITTLLFLAIAVIK
ncbi:MAG: hypothetical protein HZB51_27170 [Chloroflexi bacterium]|nr:hypothetical protein [Chloroflexota bacterium]